MSNVILRHANLRNANLAKTILFGSDLHGVDLRNTQLHGTDLRSARLCGVKLHKADMWGCIGNRREIKSLNVNERYPITYTSEVLQIGCKQYPIEEWWEFDDCTIAKMDVCALEWWKEWKDFIKMVIEKSPAKPTEIKQMRA